MQAQSLISSEAGESLSSLALQLTELPKRDVVIAYVAISSSEMLQTMGRSRERHHPLNIDDLLSFYENRSGLKYNEQILVLSVIWNVGETSRRILLAIEA